MVAALTAANAAETPGERAPDRGASHFVTVQDGLRLHVREYGARSAPGTPVVCLPGFTRTVADFDDLAPALAHSGRQRRVIAIDSRGRGRSEYDRNPQNYNLAVELADIVSVMIARAIGPAVFVGSSRGGLLTMLMSAAHPTLIAGVVLHDIGPVIEPKGLARIKSYVGKVPQPRSFEEGADILRRLMSAQFPNLTADQWLAAARRGWEEKNGRLAPTYDPRLARTLAAIDIERPLPPLWNEFDGLTRVPMLVIHGANSDVLTAATVKAMRERRPDLQVIEVADQGHTPLLEGDDLLSQVVRFVTACDGKERTPPAAKTEAE
jgi:pimeloyl-ACP methyl ester carboxylesterase